jgi:hypothetical protein
MDNLIENLNQQANNARTLRTKHEEEIIRLMKQLGLSGSKIQVGGGAELQLARRKTQSDLSWGYLEREVPAWAARSGVPALQSAALLKWLQEHRETREKEYIKKTGSVPASAPADQLKPGAH